ncbi:filamentous hemagglutinin N-terminal domain-containing protein, partial [Salmonella enterica subsp. enterica serovar Sundsvall]|nr:filamentous hemagglutinin N-terminal domain-containing protein [Salmonella enterica subsp. enterica serovar Sundsvall]
MNKIYKLKFDKRRNELVVVSEITAGMGKEKSTGHIADLTALSPFRKLLGTLTPVALLTGFIISLFPGMVLAADLPSGGQIVGGQGSISTSGNQMTIHQQTQNMATNWHSFDVGKNNTVQFVQPNSSSVALNRVTGASGSQIMGTLKANGQVFILNPNGVLFGKDARVNVAGLVASTKNISTADFMKGQYTLSGEGNSGAQVVNQGSLTTSKGGYIVLAGERVSNSGTISTPGGKSVLAAGKMVTLQLDNGGLTSVSVNGSVVNTLVENRGLISATDGKVYLTAKGQDMLLNTVVNNSGTIEAKGLASRGGEIVLDGGDSGVVSQSGYLLADSHTGQGGKITLEGQNIHLAVSSLTSATGKTGGGEVYVGGGWQGKDGNIKNASKVVMDKAATVDVSATENGSGGTAVLWSDDYTNFRGTILAKGGTQSGNGGRVETSSHDNLQASGTVDASARAGHGGEWLLDPTDVTIVGTGSDSNIDSSTSSGIFTPTADVAQILNSSIENQLNAGTNVTVKTSGTDTDGQTGNITVNASILKNTGADTTLTLLADNNIVTKDATDASDAIRLGVNGNGTGKLNLNLLAGNTSGSASVMLGNGTNISLNGGDFLAGAAGADSSVSLVNNNGQISGGNVTLNVSGGLSGDAYKLQAQNNLLINGPVTGNAGGGNTLSFIAGEYLTINSPTDISLTATNITNGGSVVIRGGNGVSLNTTTGNILLNAASDSNVTVNLSSDNGVIAMNAGGNLTLGYVTVTSGAGQDVTLRAAGNDSARVNVTGSVISTGGGNISIDRTAATQAMTIKVVNSTLNASATVKADGVQPANGSITLNAWNPDINLSAGDYNNTVRNSGSLMEISTGSILTGSDIILSSTQNGGNARSLPVYLNNATLTADDDISLTGTQSGGANSVALELRGNGNTLTAGGNITISNTLEGNQHAVLLNGTSGGSSLTAGRNIILTGNTGGGYGVSVQGVMLTAGGDIRAAGTSVSGAGVSVDNATLNASGALSLEGNSTSGAGVSANNATLNASGALSLAGNSTSGAGVSANNATLNASGALSLAGNSTSGAGVSVNNTLNASGALSLAGNSTSGAGVSANNATLNASGALSLAGNSTSGAGVSVDNATLNASGALSLAGNSTSGAGVVVSNSTLNGSRAAIVAGSTSGTTGFSITRSTLEGALSDLSNVTLSSAGSGASAVNVLDSCVVNDTNRDTLLSKQIENMTTVDMNGTAIFNSSIAAWNQHYQTDAHPYSGWIFENTTVNASSADLSGVGFSNSSLVLNSGNLSIANNGSVILNQSTVNVNKGSVSLSAKGDIADLSATHIVAKDLIT